MWTDDVDNAVMVIQRAWRNWLHTHLIARQFRTGVAVYHADLELRNYWHALNTVKKHSRYKVGDAVLFFNPFGRNNTEFALVSFDIETMQKTLRFHEDEGVLSYDLDYDEKLPKYVWDSVSELDYSKVEWNIVRNLMLDMSTKLYVREGILGIQRVY